MLTGKELGAAISEAIRLKGVSVLDVARHFGVRGPSVHGWIREGRMGKDKIPGLVTYFADVVGPEHWGLPSDWGPSRASQSVSDQRAKIAAVVRLTDYVRDAAKSPLTEDEQMAVIEAAIEVVDALGVDAVATDGGLAAAAKKVAIQVRKAG